MKNVKMSRHKGLLHLCKQSECARVNLNDKIRFTTSVHELHRKYIPANYTSECKTIEKQSDVPSFETLIEINFVRLALTSKQVKSSEKLNYVKISSLHLNTTALT